MKMWIYRVSFVVSLNLNRRQLTPSQKAVVALDMLPMLEAEAKERQRAAGKEYGRGIEKVVSESRQAIEHPDTPLPPNRSRSIHTAASILGVGNCNISEAKRISRVAPEKLEGIRAGQSLVQLFGSWQQAVVVIISMILIISMIVWHWLLKNRPLPWLLK